MLETRNLQKVYKTKKGVSVTALKNISLKFPDRGMVFLLGKSGSGKSTLLNLLGGLDKYDGGEIIIKGVSSKDFSQSYFDSYRNTYVGFIFQEYNVLEEFTVGANIALAIELQGRKADDAEISKILKEVDLEGFGDRKPNELSGGQKQRVAIARALVKNPQIIMADEPTGALDSATGKQVLDSLKKLSEDKLVIVVSHDREFAEHYADRIIELSDGNVINDIEHISDYDENGQNDSDKIVFNQDEMIIPSGYHLTEDDRKAINEYIRNIGNELHGKVKTPKRERFQETDQSNIKQSKGDFKLIKSKLPIKNSFKIGASGLKHKKIRLVFTILLSFVAFSLFALADTFGNYNHIKTCTNSIIDTNVQYASIVKAKKVGDGAASYWNDWGYKLQDKEIEKVNKETGMDFKGVYVPNIDLTIENYNKDVELSKSDFSFYATSFSGFAEITQSDLDKMGYKVIEGRLPDGNKEEIAISEFVYETYAKAGYQAKPGDSSTEVKISSYKELVGKKIKLGEKEYTITGIIDTKVDKKRYKSVMEDLKKQSSSERLANYALNQELECIKQYSLSCAVMMGEGSVQQMIAEEPSLVEMGTFWAGLYNDRTNIDGNYFARLSDIDSSKITWIDGEKKELGEKEIVVSSNMIELDGKGAAFDDIKKYLKDHPDFYFYYNTNSDPDTEDENGWKIVGVINVDDKNTALKDVYVVPDKIFNKCCEGLQGTYTYAVTSMPDKKSDIGNLVSYCYRPKNGVRYSMQNSVTFELDSVNDVLKVLSKVFLYIGIGFAVFAALMLSNFIASSISYKKQEIGILRAIGSRSNDVFRIFFSESFIIAMINFALSCIATGAATAAINGAIRHQAGILITVLNFGPRQIIMLFIISVAVAAIASFIPVYRIASKRPIEAIRNK